jgi:hypothetical protein
MKSEFLAEEEGMVYGYCRCGSQIGLLEATFAKGELEKFLQGWKKWHRSLGHSETGALQQSDAQVTLLN